METSLELSAAVERKVWLPREWVRHRVCAPAAHRWVVVFAEVRLAVDFGAVRRWVALVVARPWAAVCRVVCPEAELLHRPHHPRRKHVDRETAMKGLTMISSPKLKITGCAIVYCTLMLNL